jgi:hypothetical protein
MRTIYLYVLLPSFLLTAWAAYLWLVLSPLNTDKNLSWTQSIQQKVSTFTGYSYKVAVEPIAPSEGVVEKKSEDRNGSQSDDAKGLDIFARRGQIGDAFAVFNSLVTMAALLAAFYSLNEQRTITRETQKAYLDQLATNSHERMALVKAQFLTDIREHFVQLDMAIDRIAYANASPIASGVSGLVLTVSKFRQDTNTPWSEQSKQLINLAGAHRIFSSLLFTLENIHRLGDEYSNFARLQASFSEMRLNDESLFVLLMEIDLLNNDLQRAALLSAWKRCFSSSVGERLLAARLPKIEWI